jgi:hypothetical protein
VARARSDPPVAIAVGPGETKDVETDVRMRRKTIRMIDAGNVKLERDGARRSGPRGARPAADQRR